MDKTKNERLNMNDAIDEERYEELSRRAEAGELKSVPGTAKRGAEAADEGRKMLAHALGYEYNHEDDPDAEKLFKLALEDVRIQDQQRKARENPEKFTVSPDLS